MKKKYLILLILFVSIALFFLNINSIRTLTAMYLTLNQKDKIKEFVFGKGTADKLKLYKKYDKLGYNQYFLPKTQFTELDFNEVILKDLNLTEEISWNKKKAFQFHMEQFKDELIIIDGKGKVFFINKKFIKDSNNLKWREIKSNLNSENINVKDLLVVDNEIYVSYKKFDAECETMNISRAKIEGDNLFFELFFNNGECGDFNAGRMIQYKHDGKEGILLSTDTDMHNKELAQDDSSVYGKILFINFQTKNYLIFSKGHRTTQGLLVEKNSILAAEHGPRGGDEINLIKFGKNYGWPISSYGEPYFSEKKSEKVYHYLKSHSNHGFVEPIYSFVPSIGISQIIKIPENFSKLWQNNFFVTSLEGRAIYRILFDENYEKLIFHEKIYIGKRIRDIIYIKESNVILLALEGKETSKVSDKHPAIGILKDIPKK
jgi:hypothetical protein